MKYYGFGQFTRYIRPGYTILASSDSTLCAYDPDEQKAVIVAINDKADAQTMQFNLGRFQSCARQGHRDPYERLNGRGAKNGKTSAKKLSPRKMIIP